jgi:hypothetical protein
MACTVGSSRLQQSYGLIARVQCLLTLRSPPLFRCGVLGLVSPPPVWLSWRFLVAHLYVRTTMTDRRYPGTRTLLVACLSSRSRIPTQLDDVTFVPWSRATSPPLLPVSTFASFHI